MFNCFHGFEAAPNGAAFFRRGEALWFTYLGDGGTEEFAGIIVGVGDFAIPDHEVEVDGAGAEAG